MPCSISLWTISARSMPSSNHTGRAEQLDLARSSAMSARRRKSGIWPSLGSDAAIPTKAPTWTSRPSASIGRVTARSSRSASCSASREPVPRYGQGDREFVAGKPRDQVAGPGQLLERRSDHPQHLVADVIAVTVVDRLEAVELQRKDDQLHGPRSPARLAQFLAAGRRSPCD